MSVAAPKPGLVYERVFYDSFVLFCYLCRIQLKVPFLPSQTRKNNRTNDNLCLLNCKYFLSSTTVDDCSRTLNDIVTSGLENQCHFIQLTNGTLKKLQND